MRSEKNLVSKLGSKELKAGQAMETQRGGPAPSPGHSIPPALDPRLESWTRHRHYGWSKPPSFSQTHLGAFSSSQQLAFPGTPHPRISGFQRQSKEGGRRGIWFPDGRGNVFQKAARSGQGSPTDWQKARGERVHKSDFWFSRRFLE